LICREVVKPSFRIFAQFSAGDLSRRRFSWLVIRATRAPSVATFVLMMTKAPPAKPEKERGELDEGIGGSEQPGIREAGPLDRSSFLQAPRINWSKVLTSFFGPVSRVRAHPAACSTVERIVAT
jgi:hypothetical protein